MYMQSYKKLIIWQKSIDLVKDVYILTSQMPKLELYGLVSQMRRSAISIPSNIAEGYKRRSLGDHLRFLYIADSSGAQL
jgi:four helix bundle protein